MTTNDLSPFYREIDRLVSFLAPDQLTRALEYGGERMGVRAERAFSEYPIASGASLAAVYPRERADGTTYLSKFKSAKQQGYVMRLAAQGRIPYRRTGRLGKSITSRVDVRPGETAVLVRVGSNDPKAPYVIGGPNQQSHYHEGTWPSLEVRLGEDFDAIAEAGVDGFVDMGLRLLGA